MRRFESQGGGCGAQRGTARGGAWHPDPQETLQGERDFWQSPSARRRLTFTKKSKVESKRCLRQIAFKLRFSKGFGQLARTPSVGFCPHGRWGPGRGAEISEPPGCGLRAKGKCDGKRLVSSRSRAVPKDADAGGWRRGPGRAAGPTPDAPGGAGSQTAPSRPTSRRESGGPRTGASARPPVPQGHGAGRGWVPTGTPGRRGCGVWVCRTALSARCGGCDRSLPCLSAKTSRGPALVTLGPTLRSLDPQNCLSGKGALPGLVKSPLT